MDRADSGTATVGAVLRDATERLHGSGSPTPRLDAEVLLAHVTGRDRSWLLAHPEAAVEVTTTFGAAVARRAAGEPVAYIRGFKEWHSLRIRTDPRALIPRPETELLADATVGEITRRLAAGQVPVTAWEVATGSGAVAVALAVALRDHVERGSVRLLATDVSPPAIDLAAENLQAHAAAGLVTLDCSDLLAAAGEALPRPDVVVANLPYVSSAEVDERRGSLGFEPRIAVDGGPDGLVLLRRMFAELPSRTAPGASVLLEIGVGQADAVARLAPGGASVAIVPDLAGLDRVLHVQMPD
jgi:release factor glutamine methyltransferase